jgi:hypothetical protein
MIVTHNDAVSVDMAALDELVKVMETHPRRKDAADFPTFHRFTPGLYSRTVFLRAGESAVSRVHKTEHQFVLTQGVVKVWEPGKGWSVVQSPYYGVTKPGDRRLVVAASNSVWTTWHATDKTDLAEIEKDLFE